MRSDLTPRLSRCAFFLTRPHAKVPAVSRLVPVYLKVLLSAVAVAVQVIARALVEINVERRGCGVKKVRTMKPAHCTAKTTAIVTRGHYGGHGPTHQRGKRAGRPSRCGHGRQQRTARKHLHRDTARVWQGWSISSCRQSLRNNTSDVDQDFVFRQSRVKAILQSVLESLLHGKTYHPTKGAQVLGGTLINTHHTRARSCPSKSLTRCWRAARSWDVCGTSCWCRCCSCRTSTKPSRPAHGDCGTATLMAGHVNATRMTTSFALHRC